MKLGLYFIFYVAMILELLIFIVERDDAQEELLDIVKIMALKEPPTILVEPNVSWTLQKPGTVTFRMSGLETAKEKASVEYTVTPLNREPGNWQAIKESTRTDPSTGDGIFTWTLKEKNDYKFAVKGRVHRAVRPDLPPHAKELIEGFMKGKEIQETRSETFIVSTTGVILPFTINVDGPAICDAITGISFEKKLHIGNAEARQVKLSGTSGFRRVDGPGYITLIWDQPAPGSQTLNISGDANRGYGRAYDFASTSFKVNTHDPKYDKEPDPRAFWDVTYNFESKLAEVADPKSYKIRWKVEGTTKEEGEESPAFPLHPNTTWTRIVFTPVYMAKTEILSLRREVAVTAPPPPRPVLEQSGIWNQRDYQVKYRIDDPTPLQISVAAEVLQPQGGDVIVLQQNRKGTLTLRSPTRGTKVKVKLTVTRKDGKWAPEYIISVP
jgi:hypothetical protein